jgi:hypothetical protein
MTITVDQQPEPVNLVTYQGDTWSQTFRFLKAPDEPWDLSNVFVKATARSTLGQLTQLNVGVDEAAGTVTIGYPLAGLDPDLYDYDIQFNDGTKTVTYIHGRLRVKGDVTR